MLLRQTLPEEFRTKVESIGSSVSTEDIDTYGRFRSIEDRSHRLQEVLEAWKQQHSEERAMRKTYATVILIGLGVQIVAVNVAFFLVASGILTADTQIANTFIMAVFVEVAAMAFFIIKYLFPKVSADVLSTLEKL